MDYGISPSRVIAGLGAVIGLLTGLGTIVGWLASESFVDALATAAACAGVAYIALGCVALAVNVREQNTVARRLWAALIAVVATIGLFLGVVLPWDEAYLWGCAALGLLTAAVLGLVAMRERQKRIRASWKVCPDCAESVKVAANVCRYCGYRFRPPPYGRAYS